MNLLCIIAGHDWDYGSLKNMDGTPLFFRCCTRCEKSEKLDELPPSFQYGGHCGMCGRWIDDCIVDTIWSFGICGQCAIESMGWSNESV